MRRDAESQGVRDKVIEHIALVASAEAQLEYEASVPIADVPGELIDAFPFHPKSKPFLDSFTESELKDLAELYGRILAALETFNREDARGIAQLLKIPEWRRTMEFAKQLLPRLRGDAQPGPATDGRTQERR